jgi:hypothetical protein
MPDIKHSILIEAPPERVYPLVGVGRGFSEWWAEDVAENSSTGLLELGFFRRATVYGLKLVHAVTPLQAEWQCITGKEWSGTRLVFNLSPNNGQTVARFTHVNWQAETDYFISCNTTWGELMFRLKSAAEGKPTGPLFTQGGLAY